MTAITPFKAISPIRSAVAEAIENARKANKLSGAYMKAGSARSYLLKNFGQEEFDRANMGKFFEPFKDVDRISLEDIGRHLESNMPEMEVNVRTLEGIKDPEYEQIYQEYSEAKKALQPIALDMKLWLESDDPLQKQRILAKYGSPEDMLDKYRQVRTTEDTTFNKWRNTPTPRIVKGSLSQYEGTALSFPDQTDEYAEHIYRQPGLKYTDPHYEVEGTIVETRVSKGKFDEFSPVNDTYNIQEWQSDVHAKASKEGGYHKVYTPQERLKLAEEEQQIVEKYLKLQQIIEERGANNATEEIAQASILSDKYAEILKLRHPNAFTTKPPSTTPLKKSWPLFAYQQELAEAAKDPNIKYIRWPAGSRAEVAEYPGAGEKGKFLYDLYDKTIPRQVEDYHKKMGWPTKPKYDEVKQEWTVPITTEMRTYVTHKAQPIFLKALAPFAVGAGAVGALLAPDEAEAMNYGSVIKQARKLGPLVEDLVRVIPKEHLTSLHSIVQSEAVGTPQGVQGYPTRDIYVVSDYSINVPSRAPILILAHEVGHNVADLLPEATIFPNGKKNYPSSYNEVFAHFYASAALKKLFYSQKFPYEESRTINIALNTVDKDIKYYGKLNVSEKEKIFLKELAYDIVNYPEKYPLTNLPIAKEEAVDMRVGRTAKEYMEEDRLEVENMFNLSPLKNTTLRKVQSSTYPLLNSGIRSKRLKTGTEVLKTIATIGALGILTPSTIYARQAEFEENPDSLLARGFNAWMKTKELENKYIGEPLKRTLGIALGSFNAGTAALYGGLKANQELQNLEDAGEITTEERVKYGNQYINQSIKDSVVASIFHKGEWGEGWGEYFESVVGKTPQEYYGPIKGTALTVLIEIASDPLNPIEIVAPIKAAVKLRNVAKLNKALRAVPGLVETYGEATLKQTADTLASLPTKMRVQVADRLEEAKKASDSFVTGLSGGEYKPISKGEQLIDNAQAFLEDMRPRVEEEPFLASRVFKEEGTIPLEQGKAGAGLEATNLLPTLLRDLSNQNPSKTLSYELLQNALDSIPASKAGKINIEYNIDTRLLRFTDDGMGMSKEDMLSKFLIAGAVGKPGDVTRGGYGLAKIPILLLPEEIRVTTFKGGKKTVFTATREEVYAGTGEWKVFSEAGEGTTIECKLPEEVEGKVIHDYDMDAAIRNLLDSTWTKTPIDYNSIASNRPHITSRPATFLDSTPSKIPPIRLNIEGSKVAIHFVTTTPYGWNIGGRYSVQSMTTNKGLIVDIQKGKFSGSVFEQPDFQIVVDFEETPVIKDPKYPFLKNRTELRQEIVNEIQHRVDKKIQEFTSLLVESKSTKFKTMIDRSPTVGGMKILIPYEGKEFDFAMDVITKHHDTMEAIGKIISNYNLLLEKAGEESVNFYITIDPKIYGLRSNPNTTGTDLYAINPFALTKRVLAFPAYASAIKSGSNPAKVQADAMVVTLIHEYCHKKQFNHSEDFSIEHDRLVVALWSLDAKDGNGLTKLRNKMEEFYAKFGGDIRRVQDALEPLRTGRSEFEGSAKTSTAGRNAQGREGSLREDKEGLGSKITFSNVNPITSSKGLPFFEISKQEVRGSMPDPLRGGIDTDEFILHDTKSQYKNFANLTNLKLRKQVLKDIIEYYKTAYGVDREIDVRFTKVTTQAEETTDGKFIIRLAEDATPTDAAHEIMHVRDFMKGFRGADKVPYAHFFEHPSWGEFFAADFVHQRSVQNALNAGQKVPEDVLYEYLDYHWAQEALGLRDGYGMSIPPGFRQLLGDKEYTAITEYISRGHPYLNPMVRISDEQLMEMGRAIADNPERLADLWTKRAGEVNSAEVTGLRIDLARLFDEYTRTGMKEGPLKDEFIRKAGIISTHISDYGRGLRSAQLLIRSMDASLKNIKLHGGEKLIRELQTVTEEDAADSFMKFFEEIDKKLDPNQAPKVKEYVKELYLSSLLTTISAHSSNVITTTVYGLSEILVKHPTAAAFDALRSMLTGKPREIFFGEVWKMLQALPGGAKGGLKNALNVVLKGSRTTVDVPSAIKLDMIKFKESAFERSPNKILATLGKYGIANGSLRLMVAEDVFTRTAIGGAKLQGLAWRAAKKGKGTYEDLVKNPPSWMIDEVKLYASRNIFFDEPGPIVKHLMQVREHVPLGLGNLHFPFMLTLTRIMSRGFEKTPIVGMLQIPEKYRAIEARKVKLLKKLQRLGERENYVEVHIMDPLEYRLEKQVLEEEMYDVVGRLMALIPEKSRVISNALADQAIGLVFMGFTYGKWEKGEMTGGIPTDPVERDRRNRLGIPPYAIKIGNKWYRYNDILGPFGVPVALSVSLFERFDNRRQAKKTGEDPETIAEAMFIMSRDIATYFTENTFAKVAVNWTNMMYATGETGMKKFLSMETRILAGLAIPASGLVRQFLRAQEAAETGEIKLRDPETIFDHFIVSVGASHLIGNVPLKYDYRGRPIAQVERTPFGEDRVSAFAAQFFTFLRGREARIDDIDRAFIKTGYLVDLPEEKINKVLLPRPMYEDLIKTVGEYIEKDVGRLIKTQRWKTLDEALRRNPDNQYAFNEMRKMLMETKNEASQTARERFKRRQDVRIYLQQNELKLRNIERKGREEVSVIRSEQASVR